MPSLIECLMFNGLQRKITSSMRHIYFIIFCNRKITIAQRQYLAIWKKDLISWHMQKSMKFNTNKEFCKEKNRQTGQLLGMKTMDITWISISYILEYLLCNMHAQRAPDNCVNGNSNEHKRIYPLFCFVAQLLF